MAGCEINDDPFAADLPGLPRSGSPSRATHAESPGSPRDQRYGEKLATPDITIADLIGEVDPIKVAEGRYLSDELTIHYGLLPRTNRGIFAINELPDLAERIQVGLLNIMEERDVQIRGYKVRLPLDLFVVASANPEDYTNRGRIITPLKDRFGSQIRTHYPRSARARDRDHGGRAHRLRRTTASDTCVPDYMKEIVAELTHLARRVQRHQPALGRLRARHHLQLREPRSPTRSSARSAWARSEVVPRVSDLAAVVASTSGQDRARVAGRRRARRRSSSRLVQRAVLNVFNRHFALGEFDDVVDAFQGGLRIDVADAMPAGEYVRQVGEMRGLRAALRKLGATDPGRDRLGGRVRARRAAPQQEAEQGPRQAGFRYRG